MKPDLTKSFRGSCQRPVGPGRVSGPVCARTSVLEGQRGVSSFHGLTRHRCGEAPYRAALLVLETAGPEQMMGVPIRLQLALRREVCSSSFRSVWVMFLLFWMTLSVLDIATALRRLTYTQYFYQGNPNCGLESGSENIVRLRVNKSQFQKILLVPGDHSFENMG